MADVMDDELREILNLVVDLYTWGLKVIAVEPEQREEKYKILGKAEDLLIRFGRASKFRKPSN